MIPISVVSLINLYKEEETLKSTREWFFDALKSNLVLDEYLTHDVSFYRLLEDDDYLATVFAQIDSPAGLSYAEVVLACAEHLRGVYISPETVKESILVMDGFLILVNYLQWSWFRDWLDSDLNLLQNLKQRIASTTPTLHFVFTGSTPVRRGVHVAENAKFLEWYLSNFFIGHPSQYCDLILFVNYASSHYELEALENYAQNPNYSKLSEPGAIAEAVTNGKIKQLENHQFPQVGLEQLAVGIAQAIRLFPLPGGEVRYLMRFLLERQIPLNSQVYLDFILHQVTTLQDYTLQDFSKLQRVYLLAFLVFALTTSKMEYGKDVLKRLGRMLKSLQSLLESDEERRFFNTIVRTVMDDFVAYLVSLSDDELESLFQDGLEEWFVYMLELDIFYYPALDSTMAFYDDGRLSKLRKGLSKAISTTYSEVVNPAKLHTWELIFTTMHNWEPVVSINY